MVFEGWWTNDKIEAATICLHADLLQYKWKLAGKGCIKLHDHKNDEFRKSLNKSEMTSNIMLFLSLVRKLACGCWYVNFTMLRTIVCCQRHSWDTLPHSHLFWIPTCKTHHCLHRMLVKMATCATGVDATNIVYLHRECNGNLQISLCGHSLHSLA